jgi:hypothetical protein
MMNSPYPGSSQLVGRPFTYALLPAVGLSCVLQASWFVGTAAAEPTPVTTAIPASEAFISVAKAAQPAVVNISSSRKVVAGTQQPPSPFFDDPFFSEIFGKQRGLTP